MSKTIKLTESELIQLIEDTARKQILLNAKSKDMNFDNKISKVTKRFTKVLSRLPESTPNEKMEVIRKETLNLREAGYSYLIIGESFKLCFNTLNEDFSDILSTVFSSAGETAKEYAYGFVLDMFGIPDGHLKSALIVSLGEVPLNELPKLMTDCKFTANKVADGCVEYVMALVLADVGGLDSTSGQAGILGRVIRNALEKQLEKTEIHKTLMASIEDLICDSNNSLKSMDAITTSLTSGTFLDDVTGGSTSSSSQDGSLMSNVGG
tara:strand:+ start:2068 stop:2865 length:798 start_codon:yes stop_codon:yes gene_type:complete